MRDLWAKTTAILGICLLIVVVFGLVFFFLGSVLFFGAGVLSYG